MSDQNLESDNLAAFSQMSSRLDSFRGSSLAQEVPAEMLAQAGFYFTGQSDRVRCFSCQLTVDNWHRGDRPIERHREVSPSCGFLSSSDFIHPGSQAEDLEYLLRTGSVVDESTYPMAPHMRSEEARLKTFTSWPSSAPVRPQDLAQAGLYYLGRGDRVQCFCCGGMLGGWEQGDTAWEEHSRHFSCCFFILGHDVGNIPFQGGMEEECSSGQNQHTQGSMGSFEERLASFAGVQHPINHDRLARAGFHYAGEEDKVLCFRCSGGLKGWQPEEDPWEEHAKHYPGCSFLLAEKGPSFVNNIQLGDPQRNRATLSNQNGFSANTNEVLRSALAQKAIEMGINPSEVEKTILEKIRRTGSGYSCLEALLEDCLHADNTETEQQDEDPMKKLMKLQMEKMCKICMDRDISIVLIPCGHLVSCKECSQSLSKCPICCGGISQKLKTYIS